MNEKGKFPDPHWLLNDAEDKKMEFVVVIVSGCLHEDDIQFIQHQLSKSDISANSVSVLSNNKAVEITISVSTHKAWDLFRNIILINSESGLDVAVIPSSIRKKKLLVCDMDSTIVQTETLDDIALRTGIGEQISRITFRAMQGELDYRQSLDERVSLLAGLPEDVFIEVAETIRFNAGAEKLLHLTKEHGIRTVLVSGGFEPIVKKVARKLGFDRYVCNRAEVTESQLTGKLLEPIVDGTTKLNVLLEECKRLSIDPVESCCIGDGANDIPMLLAAGLGIGYRGKPVVRTSIPYQINSTGLESVLSMMGISYH